MITLDQAGRGMPSARLFQPPPDLRAFVEHSWIQKHDWTQKHDGLADRGLWRIVPDASPHIIYTRTVRATARLHSPHAGRLALVGPRSVHADVDVKRRIFTVGIRLRPGVLPLLTGVPAAELADRSVRVDELFGPRGRLATERVAVAKGPAAVQREMTALLRTLLPVTGEIETRMTAALGLLGRRACDLSMERIAGALSMGERTLRLLARAEVGLPPKRIARIVRVQRALQLALQQPRGSWARIAAQVGYHDQPHLIRDFRILLGETPERFLRRGNRRG